MIYDYGRLQLLLLLLNQCETALEGAVNELLIAISNFPGLAIGGDEGGVTASSLCS